MAATAKTKRRRPAHKPRVGAHSAGTCGLYPVIAPPAQHCVGGTSRPTAPSIAEAWPDVALYPMWLLDTAGLGVTVENMGSPGVQSLLDTLGRSDADTAGGVADALGVARTPDAVAAAVDAAYVETAGGLFTAYLVAAATLIRYQHASGGGRLTTWVPLSRLRRVVTEILPAQPAVCVIDLDADRSSVHLEHSLDGGYTGTVQNTGFVIAAHSEPARSDLAAFAGALARRCR